MPYTAIYAPRGNTLQAASGEAGDETFDMIAYSGTVLGDRSDERRALLFWARSKATAGGVGGSVAQFCKDNRMTWSRATFDRVRIRACERIAEAKNGEAPPVAA
ncbi:MAG: hypothetical protein WAP03_25495 [Methylorubrum rhodinum]|uniref:hypothetical protein n=1 Tax=Methylorubrum rhodinum TaxID=29428 RepID=UPI003BAFED24